MAFSGAERHFSNNDVTMDDLVLDSLECNAMTPSVASNNVLNQIDCHCMLGPYTARIDTIMVLIVQCIP